MIESNGTLLHLAFNLVELPYLGSVRVNPANEIEVLIPELLDYLTCFVNFPSTTGDLFAFYINNNIAAA